MRTVRNVNVLHQSPSVSENSATTSTSFAEHRQAASRSIPVTGRRSGSTPTTSFARVDSSPPLILIDFSDEKPLRNFALLDLVQGGNSDCVRKFLESKKVDVNFLVRGETALFAAASLGHADIVNILLSDKSIEINKTTASGFTPLNIAVQKNNLDVVKIFLKHKDIDVNFCAERSSIHLGIERDSTCTPRISQRYHTPLYSAALNENIKILTELLKHKDIDVNKKSAKGQTPLFIAIATKNLEVVKNLLKKEKIDVSLGSTGGMPPLHKAVSQGCVDIVKELLKNKNININKIDSSEHGQGYSPQNVAALRNYDLILKMLLDHEQSNLIEVAESCERSILIAKDNGYGKIEELLKTHLKNKVFDNPNDVGGEDGKTKLMIAIESKSNRAMSLIGHSQFDPNLIDSSGRSALYHAVKSQSISIIGKLLGVPGIKCNKATHKGATPLHLAAQNGFSKIVEMMLDEDEIDVNPSLNDSQITPLYMAAYYGHTDVVRLLLSHQAIDCNKTNSDGRSPLYTAAERDHMEAVRLFLEKPELNFDQTYGHKKAVQVGISDITNLINQVPFKGDKVWIKLIKNKIDAVSAVGGW